MSSKNSRSRVYCIVYGCLNSTISKPGLSYFRLPVDVERRHKWLRLVSREDLADKSPPSYAVCEEHFDPMDVLPGSCRKKLKNNSLPSLQLPVFQPKHMETLTETSLDKCTQVNVHLTSVESVGTQTSKPLSLDMRQGKYGLLGGTNKTKLHNIIDSKSEKYQIFILHKLCDKFLTKELAQAVKAHSHANSLNK